MSRKYRINNKEASLEECMQLLEDELTTGGNNQLFEEFGIDFCDITALEDLNELQQKKIRESYLRIEQLISYIDAERSIKELCKALNGYNLDDDSFDMYWGDNQNMIVSVYKNSEGFYVGQYIEYLFDDMYIEIDTGSWVSRDW